MLSRVPVDLPLDTVPTDSSVSMPEAMPEAIPGPFLSPSVEQLPFAGVLPTFPSPSFRECVKVY